MRSRLGAKRDNAQRRAFERTLAEEPNLIVGAITVILGGVNGERAQRDALRAVSGGGRGRTAKLVDIVADVRFGLPRGYGEWAFSHQPENIQRALDSAIEGVAKLARTHGVAQAPQHQRGKWRQTGAFSGEGMQVKKQGAGQSHTPHRVHSDNPPAGMRGVGPGVFVRKS